ncbi:3D domain-containing protein [Enterococcus casseliflavus]|uniref:3D domain-containing protein n=1 Tax=Enterococcus casseliflavus TaxID=37734 RepID=UPI00295583AF|nr:3D domain-containing protein [Enterococcus casseliflavus]MDV7751313.1 3D domain-containing protein [Enterococcus casseliflavus]
MKAKKIRTMLVAFVAAGTVAPIFAQAESLESLQEQESTVLKQSQAISAEVQIALTDVNQKYSEVESLKAQIAENEETLAQTKADIATAQDTIEKREAVVAERMKDIQVNGGATRDWTVLLESANIQDFINRAYAMTMLQNLEKEKIDSLSSEKEKLETLQDKAEATQTSLTADQQSLEEQAKALDSKISNLQTQLKDNESTLAKIASSKEAEESRLAAEKAAEEKAAKEAEQQAKDEAAADAKAEADAQSQAAAKETAASSSASDSASSSTSSSSSSNSSSNTSTSTNDSSSSSSNDTSNSGSTSGKTMMMESTAYSYAEAGASYFTASGTDLRKNPMAVAVDPSVIPLGTLVNVEGYGVALALDTGGAIKGNIIDVHFDNEPECLRWGRRQVKVTILE